MKSIGKTRIFAVRRNKRIEVTADGKQQGEEIKKMGEKALEALLQFLYISEEVEEILFEERNNEVLDNVRLKVRIEGIPDVDVEE